MLDLLDVIKNSRKANKRIARRMSNNSYKNLSSTTHKYLGQQVAKAKYELGVVNLNSSALLMSRVYTRRNITDMIRTTREAIYYLARNRVYSAERRVLITYCKHNKSLLDRMSSAQGSLAVRCVAADLLNLLIVTNNIQIDEVRAHEHNEGIIY